MNPVPLCQKEHYAEMKMKSQMMRNTEGLRKKSGIELTGLISVRKVSGVAQPF